MNLHVSAAMLFLTAAIFYIVSWSDAAGALAFVGLIFEAKAWSQVFSGRRRPQDGH